MAEFGEALDAGVHESILLSKQYGIISVSVALAKGCLGNFMSKYSDELRKRDAEYTSKDNLLAYLNKKLQLITGNDDLLIRIDYSPLEEESHGRGIYAIVPKNEPKNVEIFIRNIPGIDCFKKFVEKTFSDLQGDSINIPIQDWRVNAIIDPSYVKILIIVGRYNMALAAAEKIDPVIFNEAKAGLQR